MNALTPEEHLNLNTFSGPNSVEKLYNKEGFTELEIKIVEKYLGKTGAILDIGCGTGRTTIPLYKQGMKVIGIDLSKEMIGFAKKKYPEIDYRIMDACDLKFENESFDYALFSFNGLDCIYPKSKRLLSLREINRVLKKNGVFIFSSHNACSVPTNRILLGLLKINLLNLRLFTNYRLELSPTGPLLLYHGIPVLEKRTLRKTGFTVLDVVGKHGTTFFQRILDFSLYYIVKKS
jgi:Methylase involved in ubiquinone/menaquinone biosynthesis